MPLPTNEKTTQIGFEQILSWFGKFTPQFKFRLMSLRRELTLTQFDALMSETMSLFRSYLVALGSEPSGPARARRVFELMEAESIANPVTKVSCGVGCAACCKTFAKQITTDEADLLAELVLTGKVEIDAKQLSSQSKDAKAACVFLSSTGSCKVYSDRPAVCRKYHVTSPKENCGDETLGVVPRIDIVPELIASAAMSVPGNGIGFMNDLLNERINPPVQFAAALPDLEIEP